MAAHVLFLVIAWFIVPQLLIHTPAFEGFGRGSGDDPRSTARTRNVTGY